jgi:hypothetical protein
LAAAVLVTLTGLACAAPSNAATIDIPAAISRDCSVDVTQAIRSWIASVPNGSTVRFGSGACYRIDGTLELRDRRGLVLAGNGATFRATTTGGIWRSQWRALGGSNLVFRNMTVQGGNPAGGTHVFELQHQHAFDLEGVAGVEIADVHAEDLYGDCVYIGQGLDARKAWSTGIHVHDSSCARTGRMGIAVTAGSDVLVERTSFHQIALTVFDIEPNGAGFGARNITFANNEATGRLTGAFFSAVGDGPVDSVAVIDNRTAGGAMYMAVLAPPGQRRSNIAISGNSSDTGHYAPGSAALDLERVDGANVWDNDIPLSGPNMALVSALESCNVAVWGNRFPGGVVEARISPHPCPPPPASSPPTVDLTAPAPDTVFSSELNMRADARDDRAVIGVEFRANGKLLETDYSSPYSYAWHPRKRRSAYRRYVITARAVDGAGLTASDSVTVTRRRRTITTLRIGAAAGTRPGGRAGARRLHGRVMGSRTGRVVIRVERLEKATGKWVQARARKLRLGRRGRFGTRMVGLANGRWRAKASFRGTRKKAPSHSSYAHFRVR